MWARTPFGGSPVNTPTMKLESATNTELSRPNLALTSRTTFVQTLTAPASTRAGLNMSVPSSRVRLLLRDWMTIDWTVIGTCKVKFWVTEDTLQEMNGWKQTKHLKQTSTDTLPSREKPGIEWQAYYNATFAKRQIFTCKCICTFT